MKGQLNTTTFSVDYSFIFNLYRFQLNFMQKSTNYLNTSDFINKFVGYFYKQILMKFQKIIFSIAIACFVLTGCKEQVKEVKQENVSLAISGMTCEIGCAKTIQSKLSKKEGVIDAKVIFTDSIANIEFDANKTSKKELIAFVSGIAGGELYKASESAKKAHICSGKCKEKCEMKAEKMECKEDCTMACCKDKKA